MVNRNCMSSFSIMTSNKCLLIANNKLTLLRVQLCVTVCAEFDDPERTLQ